MDDVRLKDPSGNDYFEEWLQRIREIRASEKRFYQKVRDIYATAIDYDPKSDQSQLFFKKVQNKMLWATTRRTAAEIIAERSDPKLPHMGLTIWKGSKVEVTIAKNCLHRNKLDELNGIVIMYLDYAEDQAKRRKTMTVAEWEQKLNTFLTFERELLDHAGKVSAQVAEELALERYGVFDQKRRDDERMTADEEDIMLLENLHSLTKPV